MTQVGYSREEAREIIVRLREQLLLQSAECQAEALGLWHVLHDVVVQPLFGDSTQAAAYRRGLLTARKIFEQVRRDESGPGK